MAKDGATIHLAASGEGVRMVSVIAELGLEGAPKHLLPTGEANGDSLLKRNMRLAHQAGGQVLVHVNRHNRRVIQNHLDLDDASVVIDPVVRPLGRLTFMGTVAPGQTAIGKAADVFIEDLNWEHVSAQHTASPFPVSFLAGEVQCPPHSAAFQIDPCNHQIQGFWRPNQAEPGIRNIGLYVFDRTPEVDDILQAYTCLDTPHQEDAFVHDLVAKGLAGVILHTGLFFNVNTPVDYALLRHHTKSN